MSISAVVYTSHTGFTRRYAQWLARRAGLPLHELGGADAPERGAQVVYLGWLCAGSVKGLKKARKKWNVRCVCAVGMSPAEEGLAEKLRKESGLVGAPLFYLRGGYAPEQLTGAYRVMMGAMARMVAMAPAEDEAAREMRDSFVSGGDWTDEAHLVPVVRWLEEAGRGT